MSFGTDAGRDRPLDPSLATALSHPLRQRILERLSAEGEASPTQLARALDARVTNVAYHIKVLLKLNCVELVGTRQRRGALEHYYRATTHPWIDADRWAQLPASFRRQTLGRELQNIFSDASAAAVAGGLDHPDAQVRRVSVVLDQQGWQDVAALVENLLAAVRQIHADSAVRAAESQGGEPAIGAEIAVLFFRRAPNPGQSD
jgi:DNA-binding transcriptional ArsR family regulator